MIHPAVMAVDRGANDGFKFNKESEFVPIAGLAEKQLNSEKEKPVDEQQPSAASIQNNHHPALLSLLADELSVATEEIHDFELWVDSFLLA